jgi:hypothetical protein
VPPPSDQNVDDILDPTSMMELQIQHVYFALIFLPIFQGVFACQNFNNFHIFLLRTSSDVVKLLQISCLGISKIYILFCHDVLENCERPFN